MTVPAHTEVVVIGGGVIGLSAAAHLARAGANTVLLERGELGSGSSRATAGVLRTHFAGDPVGSRLAVRSMAAYRELPGDVPMDPVGYLVLFTERAQVESFEKGLPAQHAAGVRVELISADTARARNPLVDEPSLIAAAWSPQAYVSDTPAIVRAFTKAAVSAGATLLTGCPVIAMDAATGRVETGAGTITARAVVCAAGPWSGWIASAAGVDLPLAGPAEQELLHTGPLPSVPAIPVTRHAGSGLLIRKDGDGLLIGLGHPGPDREAWFARVKAELNRTYPSVDITGLRTAVTGPRDAGSDQSVFVGRRGGDPAFLYATGFSGHGLCQAPAAGELVRALYYGHDIAAEFGIDPACLAAGPHRPSG
jgi:sarcosine oxidase subunit beta